MAKIQKADVMIRFERDGVMEYYAFTLEEFDLHFKKDVETSPGPWGFPFVSTSGYTHVELTGVSLGDITKFYSEQAAQANLRPKPTPLPADQTSRIDSKRHSQQRMLPDKS